MELFERVDLIAKKYAGSKTKLAELLAIKQRTFDGYFSKKRQKNFWEILPLILKLYPFISRDWLYFDENELVSGNLANDADKSEIVSLQRKYITKLEAEVMQLKKSLGFAEPVAEATAVAGLVRKADAPGKTKLV